jgi:hypothetical protein
LFGVQREHFHKRIGILVAAVNGQDAMAAEALADELRERGMREARADGAKVPISAIGMEVHAHETSFTDSTGSRAATITFDARARGGDSNGACVLAMGFGDTDYRAAREAAMLWCVGVYPALVSWLTKKHVCEVGLSQMLVAVDGTSERYGWRVHLAPVIARLYAKDGSNGELGEIGREEILKALINTIHPFAAHRTVFWLECFAARYPEGKVDATCKFHNANWPEGREALLLWASQWADTGECILTKRQFLLFEPVAPASLPKSFRKGLERYIGTKPWWKRLWTDN